jgi:dienelactone hydrolase
MRIRPALAAIAALTFSMAFPPSFAEGQSAPPVKIVEIAVSPLPFVLQGFLRRSERAGRSPAVVLLPACARGLRQLEEDWGARISSWGYTTLTIDGLNTRGLKNARVVARAVFRTGCDCNRAYKH